VVLLLVLDEVEDVFGHFLHRLDKLGLARIAPSHAGQEKLQVHVVGHWHSDFLVRCRDVTQQSDVIASDLL
jgi:hypothetical protein